MYICFVCCFIILKSIHKRKAILTLSKNEWLWNPLQKVHYVILVYLICSPWTYLLESSW